MSTGCSIVGRLKNGVRQIFVTKASPESLLFSPVTHQATVAERYMHGLHTVTGMANNLLAQRPFFVFWFMGQIHR